MKQSRRIQDWLEQRRRWFQISKYWQWSKAVDQGDKKNNAVNEEGVYAKDEWMLITWSVN
jgi:hypothetical protein